MKNPRFVNLCSLLAAVLVTACATDPLPKDYSRPKAVIADSMDQLRGGRTNFFYLETYNGIKVDNSLLETQYASHGMGRLMLLRQKSRTVSATPATLHIVGRSIHPMPLVDMIKRTTSISEDITFTPVDGGEYTIEGKLDKNYAAIWIRDINSGEVFNKTELTGEAAYNMFGN